MLSGQPRMKRKSEIRTTHDEIREKIKPRYDAVAGHARDIPDDNLVRWESEQIAVCHPAKHISSGMGIPDTP
jgi:hypothetical protein